MADVFNKLKESSGSLSEASINGALDRFESEAAERQEYIDAFTVLQDSIDKTEALLDENYLATADPKTIGDWTNLWKVTGDATRPDGTQEDFADRLFGGDRNNPLRQELLKLLESKRAHKRARQMWRTKISAHIVDTLTAMDEKQDTATLKASGPAKLTERKKLDDLRERNAVIALKIMEAQIMGPDYTPAKALLDASVADEKLEDRGERERIEKMMETGENVTPEELKLILSDAVVDIKVLNGAGFVHFDFWKEMHGQFDVKNLCFDEENSRYYAQMENGCEGNLIVIQMMDGNGGGWKERLEEYRKEKNQGTDTDTPDDDTDTPDDNTTNPNDVDTPDDDTDTPDDNTTTPDDDGPRIMTLDVDSTTTTPDQTTTTPDQTTTTPDQTTTTPDQTTTTPDQTTTTPDQNTGLDVISAELRAKPNWSKEDLLTMPGLFTRTEDGGFLPKEGYMFDPLDPRTEGNETRGYKIVSIADMQAKYPQTKSSADLKTAWEAVPDEMKTEGKEWTEKQALEMGLIWYGPDGKPQRYEGFEWVDGSSESNHRVKLKEGFTFDVDSAREGDEAVELTPYEATLKGFEQMFGDEIGHLENIEEGNSPEGWIHVRANYKGYPALGVELKQNLKDHSQSSLDFYDAGSNGSVHWTPNGGHAITDYKFSGHIQAFYPGLEAQVDAFADQDNFMDVPEPFLVKEDGVYMMVAGGEQKLDLPSQFFDQDYAFDFAGKALNYMWQVKHSGGSDVNADVWKMTEEEQDAYNHKQEQAYIIAKLNPALQGSKVPFDRIKPNSDDRFDVSYFSTRYPKLQLRVHRYTQGIYTKLYFNEGGTADSLSLGVNTVSQADDIVYDLDASSEMMQDLDEIETFLEKYKAADLLGTAGKEPFRVVPGGVEADLPGLNADFDTNKLKRIAKYSGGGSNDANVAKLMNYMWQERFYEE